MAVFLFVCLFVFVFMYTGFLDVIYTYICLFVCFFVVLSGGKAVCRFYFILFLYQLLIFMLFFLYFWSFGLVRSFVRSLAHSVIYIVDIRAVSQFAGLVSLVYFMSSFSFSPRFFLSSTKYLSLCVCLFVLGFGFQFRCVFIRCVISRNPK